MGKSSGFKYKPGRRGLTDTPGGGVYAEKWYEKLDYLPLPKKGQPREIRLVGGLFPVFQHFIRFQRKDGSKTGFYKVCPNWDWEAGAFRRGPDATCPLCADFQEADLPQELRMLGSFRFYTDAFDVSAAKKKQSDVFGVIFFNRYAKADLTGISEIAGASVDDLDDGSIVHWTHDENAKDAKDKSRFFAGDKLPVQWDADRGLFLLKGFTGEPTDFASIIEVPDSAEIRSDLTRNGLYDRLDEALEALGRDTSSPRSRSVVRKPSGAQETESWGDEDVKPAARKSRGKVKPQEDEDWGDEDVKPAARRSRGKVKPQEDEDWGDEDVKPAARRSRGKADLQEDENWGDDVEVLKPSGKRGTTVAKAAPAASDSPEWDDTESADSDAGDNWGDEAAVDTSDWDADSSSKPSAKSSSKGAVPVEDVDDEW